MLFSLLKFISFSFLSCAHVKLMALKSMCLQREKGMRPVRFAPFLSHRSRGMPENQIASRTINMQKSMDLMARVGK
jgi:hypothetical protein